MYTREQLLNHLENNTRVLRDKNVKRAFELVDRADFVPAELVDETYEDYALPIGYNQTISQPTVIAFMLERLEVQTDDTVLDLGSGSGWTTVLLAELVGDKGYIHAVEKIPELIAYGKNNAQKYNYKNITFHKAGESLGLPQESPFDRILVSAAAHADVPQVLIDQLKQDGKMLIPVDDSVVEISRKSDGTIQQRAHYGFAFVPLVS